MLHDLIKVAERITELKLKKVKTEAQIKQEYIGLLEKVNRDLLFRFGSTMLPLVWLYMYIYRERETERERETDDDDDDDEWG